MKPWAEMIDRERDVEIDGLLYPGWVESRRVLLRDGKNSLLADLVPAYTTDHAAARLVEDEIERRGLGSEYASLLSGLVDFHPYRMGHTQDCGDLFRLVRATPAQRCEAAWRVLVLDTRNSS